MPRGKQGDVVEALRDRIVMGLHVGRLAGGDRLPNSRALATEFAVNERLILRALRTLADEGLVSVRPRSGAYALAPHPAVSGALPDLGDWLVATLLQARARGLPPHDVSDYIRRVLETRQVYAACIECNKDQIHLLCSELASDHGFVAEPADLDARASLEDSGAVRRADVLVTTMFHAAEVRVLARRLKKPWIAISLKPEIMADLSRRLQDGPVYYVATDPRFERKLRRMLEPLGPIHNLRVMLVDRDDVRSIPDDAPTFVMASARDHVTARCGSRGGPGHLIRPQRSFSDGSARQLLRFLVRANMAALAAGNSSPRRGT